jgi:uncharacterized protein
MRTRPATLRQWVRRSRFYAPSSVIHLFVGGSELHGAKVQGTDDLDIYGVYVESAAQCLGIDRQQFDHYVWSTSGNEVRNGPDDVDLTLYSLRKWAGLACKGNATALHFLFAPMSSSNSTWSYIVGQRRHFLARESSKQFFGFAENQLGRIAGTKGRGKKGQRPELEKKFGYDVKAAMHTLRLLYECEELLLHGRITLPRPERDLLIEVRTGRWTLDQVLKAADSMFHRCREAEIRSPLPLLADRDVVSKIVARAYLQHWKRHRR